MCICMQKDHTCALKILESMYLSLVDYENTKNNAACTKKRPSLQHDEVGLCMEEGVHKELHHDECNWSPDKG